MASSRAARILMYSIAVFALLLPTITTLLKSTATAEQPGWLSTSNPSLEVRQTYTGTDEIPSYQNGVRCELQKVVTRPSRLLQTEKSHDSCAIQTKYGAVSHGGLLQRPGTSVWGEIDLTGAGRDFIPIPRSDDLLVYTSHTPSGSYTALIDNVANHIDSTALVTGEVEHDINDYSVRFIKDTEGSHLLFKNTTMSFSVNGEWLIGDVPNQGMTRVNVATGQALVFGPVIKYGGGYSPGWQTAISADGRFAAISDTRFSKFLIYDLNTCELTAGSATECQYKEFDEFLNSAVENYDSVTTLRFLNNDNLEFLLKTDDGTITHHKALITAPGASNDAGFEYLGLGDSFASGEGAYSYKAYTDNDQNRCHLSLNSYPYLLSTELGFTQYESIACSGAKQEHVQLFGPEFEGQVNDGLRKRERNENDLYESFSTGYLEQVEFLKTFQPKAMTISIGGNDIGFKDIIVSCVMPGDCYNNRESREALLDVIDGQFNDLVQTYTELKAASPQTRFYILGYPQVAKIGPSCDPNVHLSQKELLFANQLVSYLNEVIKQASAKAGVYYTDVENSMEGHRFCEANYSDVAFNGLTAGNDKIQPEWLPVTNPFNGPIANESYHPNQVGHRLFATTINTKTGGLTAPMPNEQPSKILGIDRENLDILDIDSSSEKREVTIMNDSITDDTVFIDDEFLISLPHERAALEPGSGVEVWLHSDPVKLGQFTVDSNGQLFAQVKVPVHVPAGFHQIHLYAKNVVGQTIDIYKHIFVAYSPSDIDGDEIPNTQDLCLLVEPAGQDYDQDGIDDACDGLISEPPATSSNQTSASVPNKTVALSSSSQQSPGGVTQTANNPATDNPTRNTNARVVATSSDKQVQSSTTDQAVANTLGDNQPASTNWWLYGTIALFVLLVLGLVLMFAI